MSDQKDQAEQAILDMQVERERLELAEFKDLIKFNEQERNHFRAQWSLDKHSQEQEILRRAVETCVSVLRSAQNQSDGPAKAAYEKLKELIPKLG